MRWRYCECYFHDRNYEDVTVTILASPPASRFYDEPFTDEERVVLDRFVTNTDGPVFALVNLPEVVKGALFARYSRSAKSVRRILLDEFVGDPDTGVSTIAQRLEGGNELVDTQRAEDLYQRVFNDYGDDSVAQLGGVHLACEQASNVLTKILEWGRLAAYLEQSTRYIFYDQKLGDRYRYMTPPEIDGAPLGDKYRETMDWLFDTYSSLIGRSVAYFESLYPQDPNDSDFIYRSTIRAKSCDDLRGLLPAGTISNVGIFGTGQAYEAMLLRMRAHPLAEARQFADLMLTELRKVIPAFMRRVDVPERGGRWSDYLAGVARSMEDLSTDVAATPEERPEVTLVDWDPEAETKIAAAALYAYSDLPDDQLLRHVRSLGDEERSQIIKSYVGDRSNRRHKPGRGMERSDYRFDILCDYGIFRDLQRHRLLTIEWQRLSPAHGYITPQSVTDIGATDVWDEGMERSAEIFSEIAQTHGGEVAQYAVPFANKIRFFFQLNAREAFHLLELRTAQGGHPDYRRVCQEMHRLIRDQAGHRILADAMEYVDHSDYELARLESERRSAAKRAAAGATEPS